MFLFLGIRAKVYSVKMEDNMEKQRCKGVDTSWSKKHINHNKFGETLQEVLMAIQEDKQFLSIQQGTFYRIESHKHQLKTIKKSKKTLSYYNDKKFFLSPNKAYSFGHKDIKV